MTSLILKAPIIDKAQDLGTLTERQVDLKPCSKWCNNQNNQMLPKLVRLPPCIPSTSIITSELVLKRLRQQHLDFNTQSWRVFRMVKKNGDGQKVG